MSIEPDSFVLARDDDSHWYLIRESDQERFDKFLKDVYQGDGGGPEDWHHFDGRRIDGPLSIRFKQPSERA